MTLRIAITPGEPAGIGPELVVQLAQREQPVELVAVADPELLAQRAALLGLPLTLEPVDFDAPPRPQAAGSLKVLPVNLRAPSRPGTLDSANAAYVLETLASATDACRNGHCQALVTAPVHKGVINDGGVAFSGHTEYLAERCGVPKVVMMLATESLRVALATTHLPLRQVADAITDAGLSEVLGILRRSLRQQFGHSEPRILVLGLNPHAGEGGHLGHEEIDIIEPCLERLRASGMQLIGPLPADTAFTPHNLAQCDAVLAMYHDQGLPVLKAQGFGEAVNITLGLPIVRTSVDHGTALDLAGSGRADPGSLYAALRMAITLAGHHSSTTANETPA